MKNNTCKTSILTLYLIALSFATQAQFPNFIKVDTGAITQLWGGHVSSSCSDMDNDGDLDLFVGNSGVYVSRMFSCYKNERNGFYVEMPEFISDYNGANPIADIDNDGDADLLQGSGNEVMSYANNGYGTYNYNTFFYLWFPTYYHTLLDLNNDGFLDVLGINGEGSVNYNDGSGGFVGTTGLGIFQAEENVYLHGVSWGDLDDDGDLDFYGGYTSSGGIPINVCYLNDGNGWFTQFDPTSPIVEGACATPCVNWVDYDNDGDMDLYVHDIMCDNALPALYENLGDMQFIRHEIIDEMYRHSHANSSVWGDLDNDADLDLFISIENNQFPWPPYSTSATPYNVIYINEGNGEFTDFLGEHPLISEDSHTALILDHDNDGDLDVLMTRYSWSNDGYNNLFVNEGNENSWINITCEGTTSNRSAIGTRVQAKCFVNGSYITQTREITPFNGHLSPSNLRVHFGLGNADNIDTLLIRWPSGIVDIYLDIEGNHFYRAIENEELTIEYKATNYISYSPGIIADSIYYTTNIDLNEHFHLVVGDTLPPIIGDTLLYSVYNDSNPGIVQTEITENTLTIEPLDIGETTIEILVSAGFTEKLISFMVNVVYAPPPPCLPEGITFTTQAQIDSFQTNYPGCTEIEGDVIISGDDIANLNGLNSISTIKSGLYIYSTLLLTNLTGLESLISISGNLHIGAPSLVGALSNQSFTSFTGLNNLTFLGGDFWIMANLQLKDFNGLDSLASIGGELRVGHYGPPNGSYGNPAMINCAGIENLSSIGGDLLFLGNDSLTSLIGLENISPSSISGILIYHNSSLSDCDIQSICEYLANPIGTIEIYDNAQGCNSQQQVEDACWTSVNDISLNEHLTISPNPNSGFVTLNYTVSEPGILLFEIFDLTGTKVKSIEIKDSEPGIHELEIDLSNLPIGIYFCTLKTSNEIQTKKIIKL